MHIPARYPAVVALIGAAWLQSGPLSSVDPDPSLPALYRTKANAVLCETPFQIRKAIVAMGQDDGAEIMTLGCTRPGTGRKAHLISTPVPQFGPWLVALVSTEGLTVTMWGYPNQFEPDEY